ncbi:MAG: translation initiation factor IF-5A [Nanoarchaeota archaeon]
MSEVKRIQATSAKKGTSIIIGGIACTVKDVQTSKPGKHGHAKCRIEAISMIDGSKKIIVVPGHEKLESPIIIKRTAQILSINDDTANVMDIENYETFDLKIPSELKESAQEGKQVSYWIILNEKVMKEVKG